MRQFCCQGVLDGPVSIKVSAGCVGSHFECVIFWDFLGNCAKGVGVLRCLLQVVLTIDELDQGGRTVGLRGFSCVVNLGVLSVIC